MRKRFFRLNPVLPVVYDDSLTYYEAICKLAQQLDAMGEQIDSGLVEFIREVLPELISDVVYDAQTGTLEFTLVDDVTEDQILNDPIKRIAVNGLSRPVVDEDARKWRTASWLYNKNVCFYGDSTLFVNESYYPIIANSGIPASTTRRGASGTTLINHGLQLIQDATDLNTYDYVFVCYGINDWSGRSKNEWITAVSNTITSIINKGSEPVFVFPWVVYIPTLQSDGFINNYGCDMAGYVDGAIEICKRSHVKYFNLCDLANVTKSNYSRKLTPSSNGYYLHEGTDLGKYIANLILTGVCNTGLCNTGMLNSKPFKKLISTNCAYPGYAATKTLIGGVSPTYRRGSITGLSSARTNIFHTITTGNTARITGFFHHSDDNGYIIIGAISAYDQTATFIPICRVNNNSLFDFTCTPPNSGNDWSLAIQCPSGQGVICDLTVYGVNGATRLITTTAPDEPALKVTYNSSVSEVVYQGYVLETEGSLTMTAQVIRLGEAVAAGSSITIGNIGFYPQAMIYGTCRIGSSNEHFRIKPNGDIELHVLNNNYTATAQIFIDTTPITIAPFYVSLS